MTNKKNRSHEELLFIAPGLLEVPNSRGGGIENNIFNLAIRCTNSTVIFAPKSRCRARTSKEVEIVYSRVPATKDYPLNPHPKLSYLWLSIPIIVFNIGACLLILKRLKTTRFVLVFDRILGVLPLIIARLSGIRTAYVEYNIWPWSYRGNYRSATHYLQVGLGKLTAKASSVLIANSASIKEGMLAVGIISPSIHLLPSAIDMNSIPRRTRRRDESMPLEVLYVGRLVPERGADLLEGIIRATIASQKRIRFTIAGGGPLLGSLQELGREQYEDNVCVLGQVSAEQAISLMSQSDLVLFISKNENYGSLALLESMAVGCPVLATDVGSTSRLVQDGINGLLVRPSSDAISDAILFAADSPEVTEHMGENARATAMDFDWSAVSAMLQQALEGDSTDSLHM